MSIKKLLASTALAFVLLVPVLLGQQKPPASGTQEFPVLMRQNLEAGKTPVGAKVEAKLTMATLIGGKVVPKGATFSGVVVESAAKSAGSPSRLCVRMDSVSWKKGSEPIQAYLTAWYHPDYAFDPTTLGQSDANRSPSAAPEKDRAGSAFKAQGLYDGTVSGENPAPAWKTSERRVPIGNVASVHAGDDARIVLTSSRSNVKFDKLTTYVLATGDLTDAKPARVTSAAGQPEGHAGH